MLYCRDLADESIQSDQSKNNRNLWIYYIKDKVNKCDQIIMAIDNQSVINEKLYSTFYKFPASCPNINLCYLKPNKSINLKL